MLCHIHPPPGRSSRHRRAGLTDSQADSRGAFGNSCTGDAFCGTLSFILAGRGTAGQSRRCELAGPLLSCRDLTNARYGCLAMVSRLSMPSQTALKLTKISCDIGATPAEKPSIPLHRPATSCIRPRRDSGVEPHYAGSGRRVLERDSRLPQMRTIIFHAPTWARHIIPLMSSTTAILPALIFAAEYGCCSGHFHRLRRSAKAFPFGLPGTRFWPARSTLCQ